MSATTPFARRSAFWRLMRAAVLVGALAGLAVGAFLFAEAVVDDLVWAGDEQATGWFTGPLRSVPVLLGGGVVVGLLRTRWGDLAAPDPNFVDEIIEGHADPRRSLGLVLVGLVSVVSGASVGPEGPTATAGAGIGTLVARRRGGSDDEVADMSFAGIAGVFGALTTFPFAVPVIALEVFRHERIGSYQRLVPGLVSGSVALAMLYPVLGTPFLGSFPLPPVDLASWHLAAGVVIGLVGAVVGVTGGVVTGLVGLALAQVRPPMARALVGAAGLAALGWVLPLTLFSGREQLATVLDLGVAELGAGLLVATVLGKLVAFGISIRAGFYGGAILPLFFAGGVAGLLLATAWPALPATYAVAGVAAATATSLVALPLSLLVLAILMFSTGIEAGAVVTVAVVTAYVVVHGTAILPLLHDRLAPARGSAPDDHRDVDAPA